jgi:hypothetical protein
MPSFLQSLAATDLPFTMIKVSFRRSGRSSKNIIAKAAFAMSITAVFYPIFFLSDFLI